MSGLAATISSSMPVSSVTTGGIGRFGFTSVTKRSTTSPALIRTAPISVTFESPGEPPVVSRSTTQKVAEASPADDQSGGASPTRSRPSHASRASPSTISATSRRWRRSGQRRSRSSCVATCPTSSGRPRRTMSAHRRSGSESAPSAPGWGTGSGRWSWVGGVTVARL